jgi:hypothetical protein
VALALARESLSLDGVNGDVIVCVSRMDETSSIDIKEAYRNYLPPINASKIVGQLLRAVPEKYLKGLDCIVLTNEASLSRRDRVGRVWSSKRKFDKSMILGRYHPATRSSPPYIELRIDKILQGLPALPRRIPLMRDAMFGHVLFHEIGHHIHSTIRPEHREKEDVADDWAGRINAKFVRTKYWHLVPLLVPASRIYRLIKRRGWIKAG